MLQRTTWSQVWRHGLQYLGMDGSPPPEVGAPPVVLRSYRGDELPALFEAVTASLDHLRPWLPWASAEPLEPGLSEFVRQSVEKFRRAENFDYAIWEDVASLLVGGAGLHPRLGPGRIEIGYWVRDGWLRRGIATAAARALTSAAFTMPGIEEVHIHCDEANVASAAVPNRLGFSLAKIVDDEVDAPFGDRGAHLLVAAERPAQEARHRQIELARDERARRAGRVQLVPRERPTVEVRPLHQVGLSWKHEP